MITPAEFDSKLEEFSIEKKIKYLAWLMQDNGATGSFVEILYNVKKEFPEESIEWQCDLSRKRNDLFILERIRKITDIKLLQTCKFSFGGTYEMPILFWAIRHGHRECIRYLMGKVDLNIKVKMKREETALNMIIDHGFSEFIRPMINAGAVCASGKSPAYRMLGEDRRNSYRNHYFESNIMQFTDDEIIQGIREIVHEDPKEFYIERKSFCNFGDIVELCSNVENNIENKDLRTKLENMILSEIYPEIAGEIIAYFNRCEEYRNEKCARI